MYDSRQVDAEEPVYIIECVYRRYFPCERSEEKSPKAPAPGWAVDSYKMVIVNKRESRFLDI